MSSVPRQFERDTPLYPTIVDGVDDTDAINSLLRGELAAVESYDQVLSKFVDESNLAALREIRREHFRAVNYWQDRVRAHGGEPVETSGVWGVITAAITGSAKVFGWKAALAALKQGEELGMAEYESAADNDAVAGEWRSRILSEWLPTCRRHVDKLTALQNATG